jgi:hypothetical protein
MQPDPDTGSPPQQEQPEKRREAPDVTELEHLSLKLRDIKQYLM